MDRKITIFMKENAPWLICGGSLVLAVLLYVTGTRNQATGGRYELKFAPKDSETLGEAYFIDTASGRVWGSTIKKRTTLPSGGYEIDSSWDEVHFNGFNENK